MLGEISCIYFAASISEDHLLIARTISAIDWNCDWESMQFRFSFVRRCVRSFSFIIETNLNECGILMHNQRKQKVTKASRSHTLVWGFSFSTMCMFTGVCLTGSFSSRYPSPRQSLCKHTLDGRIRCVLRCTIKEMSRERSRNICE